MKKLFFLLLCMFCIVAFGQRSKNVVSFHGKVGYMEGRGILMQDFASSATLGVQQLLGKGYLWEANLFAQDFSVHHEKIENPIPYSLYGLNVMGGWSLESLNPLYFNFKIGGFGGYYIINKNEGKDEEFGTTFMNRVSGVNYGALAEAEAEIILLGRLSAVGSFTQFFYPKDSWIRWNYTVQAGLKFYL